MTSTSESCSPALEPCCDRGPELGPALGPALGPMIPTASMVTVLVVLLLAALVDVLLDVAVLLDVEVLEVAVLLDVKVLLVVAVLLEVAVLQLLAVVVDVVLEDTVVHTRISLPPSRMESAMKLLSGSAASATCAKPGTCQARSTASNLGKRSALKSKRFTSSLAKSGTSGTSGVMRLKRSVGKLPRSGFNLAKASSLRRPTSAGKLMPPRLPRTMSLTDRHADRGLKHG
mmetsp:Transcript_15913/g.37529  ORF Transcript_15913/g.37529 Transcript_15913/m.37529 type:complete len:230 (+) Transcript_15913:487-1176(+)